jgi:hypothetical protein
MASTASRLALSFGALFFAVPTTGAVHQLCALVAVESAAAAGPAASVTQLFASVGADGSLGSNVTLSEEPISGLLAGDARSGRFSYSPPLQRQQLVGLVEVDTARGTAAPYALHNPAGYAGTFVVGALEASDAPGDLVAVMASADSKAWVAVAELTPADGTPRVRANLSLEATGWDELFTGFSAFDPRSRSVFLVAAFAGAQNVIVVPLDAPLPPDGSLANASLPDGFDMIGMTYAPATNSVVAVGIVALPQTYGLVALDVGTLTWRTLIAWKGDDFFLSGLGEIAVDPSDGRSVYTVLANAQGVHVIPVVDAGTGKETGRITMASVNYFVSSLAFCNATFFAA